jgi:PDZ domain-containing secreted protein
MRRHAVTAIVFVPLLLGFCFAAQTWSVDKPGENWSVFSSEEAGTSSYLGVDIADITTERLSTLKLKEEKGVEITMVDQDAPAGKAGLKEHDVILTMNGTAVESGAQLRRMIHETPPGRLVTLGLSRDGQPMTVKVQLANKHTEYAKMPKPGDMHVNIPEIHIPDIDIPAINMVMATSSARSGLMVENITTQLGDFFGVKNGNGVLVRSVEKGSRAERAGFRAGDVVVKVNGEAVHDTSDFTHAVRSRHGNSVNVVVIRDKKEQNLTLSLPTRKESGDMIEEESWSQEPLIHAQRALEMTELQNEIARLRPQMELAAENSRRAVERLRKEFCPQERQILQQSAQQKKQLEKDLQNLRRELLRLRDEWI